jgi:hypothetical protein
MPRRARRRNKAIKRTDHPNDDRDQRGQGRHADVKSVLLLAALTVFSFLCLVSAHPPRRVPQAPATYSQGVQQNGKGTPTIIKKSRANARAYEPGPPVLSGRMARPIRVLFIHGLESHPNGSKTKLLREQGFEVVAPNMHMALWQWRRRNSAIRQVVRLLEPRLVLAGAVGLTAIGIKRSSPWMLAGTAGLTLGWGALRAKAIFAKALGKSFDDCVAIVRDTLRNEPIDVVVGSSWGGAVAVELLAAGAWAGPTALLAPAVHRVAVRSRRGDGSEMSAKLRALDNIGPVIVFHDPTDDTVPFADSVALTQDSHLELRSVDAGGHRLLGLLTNGELKEALQCLVREPASQK